MERRYMFICPPAAGTCRWILNDPSYVSWRKGDSPFMWINGQAGTGKSTMMKFIEHQISDELHESSSLVVSFYFNIMGDELERSVSGLYRSVIVQLLEGFPYLPNILEKMYFRREALPHADFFRDASVAVLKELLAACVNGLKEEHHVYCMVDALDEVNLEEALELVGFLRHVDCRRHQFSVCFASRHSPAFDIQIPAKIVIDHGSGLAHDIELYINAKLRLEFADHADQLKSLLIRNANGMFASVALQIAELNRLLRNGEIYSIKNRLMECDQALREHISTRRDT